MGYYAGSFELGLANNRPAHVVLVDATGMPVFSGSSSNSMGAGANLSTVLASSVSVTIQANNSNRKALHIVNESNKTLLIAYAASATTAIYTEAIAGGSSYTVRDYTGVVSGIWNANNPGGAARVTEVV